MTKVLDSLCDYRRYCWNQGLDVWNDLYDQRVEMVPADLREKSQLAIKDKSIVFSEEEQELLDLFPSPSHRVVQKVGKQPLMPMLIILITPMVLLLFVRKN